MTKRIISRRNRRSIGSMLNLLLVILYILSSSGAGILHSIVHETQQVVSHAGEDEKDPCHRSIYHNGTQGGCSHGTHFIASDKCPMCDIVFHVDQNVSIGLSVSHSDSSEPFDLYRSRLDSHEAMISSSRAPPAVV